MPIGRRLLWHLVLFASVGCAPIVTAEFSDIEVTRSDVFVPGYVNFGSPQSGDPSITFSFVVDSRQLGASTLPSSQNQIKALDIHRIGLTAKSRVTDLSFIRTLHLLASLPQSKTLPSAPTPQVEIADYVSSVARPTGSTFSLLLPEPVSLLPLVRPTQLDQRKITVTVNLSGPLPTQDWTTDVSMKLSIDVAE